jgi:hypothetical protein
MRMNGGHIAWMVEMKNMYKCLVRKPEGKRPLGRPGCRWEDNIRMDLPEIGWEGVDWIWLMVREEINKHAPASTGLNVLLKILTPHLSVLSNFMEKSNSSEANSH